MVALMALVMLSFFITSTLIDSKFTLLGIDYTAPTDQVNDLSQRIGFFPPIGPVTLNDVNDEIQEIIDTMTESIEELSSALATFLGVDEHLILASFQFENILDIGLEDFGIERKEHIAESFTLGFILFCLVLYKRISTEKQVDEQNRVENHVIDVQETEVVAAKEVQSIPMS
eukprot:snap_masked-scaffold_16-processed-gene-3.31-mRNA-1 protein AED:1.00 eAED:1.00 QI:0/0/0/0/1/1/5/0/171